LQLYSRKLIPCRIPITEQKQEHEYTVMVSELGYQDHIFVLFL
jgi:hypothetical protein